MRAVWCQLYPQGDRDKLEATELGGGAGVKLRRASETGPADFVVPLRKQAHRRTLQGSTKAESHGGGRGALATLDTCTHTQGHAMPHGLLPRKGAIARLWRNLGTPKTHREAESPSLTKPCLRLATRKTAPGQAESRCPKHLSSHRATRKTPRKSSLLPLKKCHHENLPKGPWQREPMLERQRTGDAEGPSGHWVPLEIKATTVDHGPAERAGLTRSQ